MAKKGRKIQYGKAGGPLLVSAAFVIIVFFLWDVFFNAVPQTITSECEVHFIDVGQGDCTLFMTDEAAIVIDAGPRDVAENTKQYIRSYTDTIDYFILTHPDEDHIGGAIDIINGLKIKNIIMTDASKGTYTFTKLLDTIENSNANVIQGVKGLDFTVDGMNVELLGPVSPFDGDYNDYSIVTRVSYGDVSVIVTGDAEKSAEKKMLKEYGGYLKSDILKLGHHGSSTSSYEGFVAAVAPEYAVVSCGKNNSYKHPHEETIDTLNELSIDWYRTDRDGTIVFETDGDHLLYRSNTENP